MIELTDIELPYIERNTSRHGRTRYYLRIDGRRLGRLPDDPGSEPFTREYWRLRGEHDAGRHDQQQPAPVELPKSARPGTFHWLCAAYLRSDACARLDGTTRAKRRAIIEAMLLEPVKPGDSRIFALMPLAALTLDNLEVLRDRKKAAPFAADERVKVLCQIFETTQPDKDGKPIRIMRENTAKLVKRYRVKSDGHHTLLDFEVAQYIKHHGSRSKAVLGLVLLMYTGLRISDLTVLGPQHRRADSFTLRLFKNRNRSPVTLQIPLHPILAGVLAWHPVRSMTYMTTEHGKSYTIKGLGNRVSEWFFQAGLPHCTAHSVRKGLATSLAENEATDSMLDGMFGWKDGKTSKIYTRRKQQAKLARQAVQRIDWGEIGNDLPHPPQGVPVPAATPEKKTN